MGVPVVYLKDPATSQFIEFADPLECIVASSPDELLPAFESMQQARREGLHLAGWFSYEVGKILELGSASADSATHGPPLLWFGAFATPRSSRSSEFEQSLRAYAGPLSHEWTRQQYRSRFANIQEHIAAGNIYQANLSFRSHFHFCGDPLALFTQLLQDAKVPYAAYIDTGVHQILSLSPELFFSVGNGHISTQPMKGTSARGLDSAADAQLANALQASAKNRAENVMIVDLMRNDLGRIAIPGSVHVSKLCSIRSYPTFHTLISEITAQLNPFVPIELLVRTLFPAGSITGAPKRKAMQVLNDLEQSKRSIYCGAIGSFAPDGDASFNVAIRTLWLSGGQGTLGIGGGVLADSNVDEEYDECLLKARWYEAARRPIGLIETLCWAQSFVRLDAHLDRMAASARYFRIPFLEQEARRLLNSTIGSLNNPTIVRLELAETGAFEITTRPLLPHTQAWRYRIASHRVDQRDPLLVHKTTWRDFYDDAWSSIDKTDGIDEILFLNQREEITEGSRSNLFLKVGDKLLTPPSSAGLLPGLLRAELLANSQCFESVLTLDDLNSADEVYFGNSVRGLVKAQAAGDAAA